MTKEKVNKWDYKVVGKFNDIFYKDLLQTKHLFEGEKYIKTVNTPESKDAVEEDLNTFFFVLNKKRNKYLLESKYVNELPISITSYERVGYKGEGYVLIKGFDTARFKPEKKMSFRELVNIFAEIKHSEQKDFNLWKIIVFTSLIDRINVRISGEPGFGKDSVVDLLNDLVGGVAVVQKPTIAKLEYLSVNKVLMVNELMNLTTQEYRDIEQYLLSVGAFKNNYTKRSRAGSMGREEYDISDLSLILSYNNIDCYPAPEDYFDKVQTRQVKERFIPFKFKGVITENFPDIPNPEEVAINNKNFFSDVARTIKYFKESWRKELKPYPEINFGLKGRWKRNFDTITRFINLYAETEEEYKDLCAELYSRHLDYTEMVYESKNLNRFNTETSSNDFGLVNLNVKEEFLGEEINVKDWVDKK